MKINVFHDVECFSIDQATMRRLVTKILKSEKKKLKTLNIIITDNVYLKKLNTLFFKKHRATNVISFAMDDVAEIYVSAMKSRDREELYYYIIHGLLHILGYEHRTRHDELLMEEKCLHYLNEI
jgi:ssRNA-specific RNase YbeY (16S rRNA maturation enzyme)